MLTATDELASAREFVVAAISTKIDDPLPPDSILVPWSSDGRARSGLTTACVVKCKWLRRVKQEEVVSVRGHLPSTIVNDIMQIVVRG